MRNFINTRYWCVSRVVPPNPILAIRYESFHTKKSQGPEPTIGVVLCVPSVEKSDLFDGVFKAELAASHAGAATCRAASNARSVTGIRFAAPASFIRISRPRPGRPPSAQRRRSKADYAIPKRPCAREARWRITLPSFAVDLMNALAGTIWHMCAFPVTREYPRHQRLVCRSAG